MSIVGTSYAFEVSEYNAAIYLKFILVSNLIVFNDKLYRLTYTFINSSENPYRAFMLL